LGVGDLIKGNKLVINAFLIFLIILGAFNLNFASVKAQTVTAMDFDIDLVEYEKIVSDYTYLEWIALLQSYDLPSDFLMGEVKPERILVLDYYGDDAGTFGTSIEIYEYATIEDAELEFGKQKPYSQSDYGKRMFNRYETEEIMFFKNRFLVFAYCVPIYGNADHDRGAAMLNDLMDDFIENFIDVIRRWRLGGGETLPPPVSFSGEVIWGIKPFSIVVPILCRGNAKL